MRKIFNGLGLLPWNCEDTDNASACEQISHPFVPPQPPLLPNPLNSTQAASNRRPTSIKTSTLPLTSCPSWTLLFIIQLFLILSCCASATMGSIGEPHHHHNRPALLSRITQQLRATSPLLRHERTRRNVMLVERMQPPTTKPCQSCRLEHPLNKHSVHDSDRPTATTASSTTTTGGASFPRKLRVLCRRLNLTYCHLFERWQRHLLKKQNHVENQNSNVIAKSSSLSPRRRAAAAVSARRSNNELLAAAELSSAEEPVSSTSRLPDGNTARSRAAINRLRSSLSRRGKRNAAHFGDHRKRELYSGTSFLLEILPSGVVQGSYSATKYSKYYYY